MERRWPAAALLLLGFAAVAAAAVEDAVTYDKKAVVINGERKILFSGSIHYPRSTPEVTAFLLPKAPSFLLTFPAEGSFLLGGVLRGFSVEMSLEKAKCCLIDCTLRLPCFRPMFRSDAYRHSPILAESLDFLEMLLILLACSNNHFLGNFIPRHREQCGRLDFFLLS
jgi:hypothetical protein